MKHVASKVRIAFGQYLKEINGWSKHLWKDRAFRLSDRAVYGVNALFSRDSNQGCSV